MVDQADRLRQISRERGEKIDGASFAGSGSRVVAVSSGKGGVGKTNLVVNLALTLARWDYRVVIIDADLGMANVDVLVNAFPRHTLEDVLEGDMDVRDIILEGPANVKIVPGGSGMFSLANLDQARRSSLVERLQVLEEEGDILFIDTAAGLSRNVISFVASADEAIIVTTPEPTALTDAYGMIKVLREKGIKKKVHLVVNFASDLSQGEEVYRRMNKVVGKYLSGLEVNFLGPINRDPLVTRSVQDCEPLVLSHPQAPAAQSIQRIAQRFVYAGEGTAGETGESSRRGVGGFLKRLQGFLSQ